MGSLEALRQCKIFVVWETLLALIYLAHVNKEGAPHVDLALNLNVLAVFAVFTFVAAVLLGAF
jgi:hypothetical protein